MTSPHSTPSEHYVASEEILNDQQSQGKQQKDEGYDESHSLNKNSKESNQESGHLAHSLDGQSLGKEPEPSLKKKEPFTSISSPISSDFKNIFL